MMNLQPFEYITPSMFSGLSTCFLQAAFRADSTYFTFQSPAVRLGTACHALLERVASGALSDLKTDAWQSGLEAIWQEEIHRQEIALLAAEQEKHFGRAETWPKYSLQKARVFLKAEKLLTYHHQRLQRGQPYGRSSVERSYSAFNGRLRGRADVVYESSRGVELVDYKTGPIFDEDEAGNATVKESYRRQLYLYAAMHRHCTGVWPVRGHLVPLTGRSETIEIDPIEAERLAQLAMQQMEQFNERITQVTHSTELATPSMAACRFCGYKADCPAFWKFPFVPSAWGSVAHLDVTVREITQPRRGDSTFLLQVAAGTLPDKEYICHTTRPANLSKGQRAIMINVLIKVDEATHTQTTLKIHDHTVIY